MNQSEIVARLAAEHEGMSYKEMHAAVRKLVSYLEDALIDDKRIEIRGFGVLKSRSSNPRNSHNPSTGEKIWVESRRYGHFKPGQLLNKALNPD